MAKATEDSNYYSNGNCNSNGNYYSNGNCNSNGNYFSDGNCNSNGNYNSHGNCNSNGNYNSDGNYFSDGNCSCKGTYKCLFCYGLKGAAFQAFNQQLTEDAWTQVYNKIREILDGFRPYVTNFVEMEEAGWHKIYKSQNEYVTTFVPDPKDSHHRQHDAWSRLSEKKKYDLVQYISTCKLLDNEKALAVFKEITGIGSENSVAKQKAQALEDEATKLLAKAKELRESL